jgi:5-methyltetrahydropteroyltriglutamate--homocysteine methyltransferase
MKRSEDRFLTSHVGSLPTPPGFERQAEARDLEAAVEEVVARQRRIGIDVINEGEYSKGGTWIDFAEPRLSGFEVVSGDKATLPGVNTRGRDRAVFAEFYADATARGILFHTDRTVTSGKPRSTFICSGPIRYVGQALLEQELTLARAAQAQGTEAFLTSVAPASLEPYRENRFYQSQEELLYALADAMRVEYEAIVAAGFILQVDDAWLPALWDRIGIEMGLEAFLKYCTLRVEVLNHALRNCPEDRVRYHLCWGSWHGPHAFDLEMKYLVDLMLKVRAQCYSFEAANARHEHEYIVWDEVRLPEGKILMPGVVAHSTNVIEHPLLVAQRIERFAKRVGPQNVIAGTDCGFGGRAHPQIAWAKLEALVEGARLASRGRKIAA